MSHICYNGKLIASRTALITSANRGLRYGDGLFETLLFHNKSLLMWEAHMDRLWKGMEQLQFDIPVHFNRQYLETKTLQLLAKNQHKRARVRINIIRGNGGVFDPENLFPEYIIETWPLEKSSGINSNGLQLGIYKDALKVCDSFSNLKSNNYLPYIMGALFARKEHYNDAVILNQHQRVSDTCIANIFFIKNGEVFTPALSEGCVAGTMRRYFIENLPAWGYPVHETAVSPEDLYTAEEVFLTNAITPIKWASSLQDNRYGKDTIQKIYSYLLHSLPQYF
ncbi:MAG: aminotransferase class IV [Ferruginibacter sp.]